MGEFEKSNIQHVKKLFQFYLFPAWKKSTLFQNIIFCFHLFLLLIKNFWKNVFQTKNSHLFHSIKSNVKCIGGFTFVIYRAGNKNFIPISIDKQFRKIFNTCSFPYLGIDMWWFGLLPTSPMICAVDKSLYGILHVIIYHFWHSENAWN